MGDVRVLQVAAMALSPIAALSLALVQDGSWKQSMRDFADGLRHRLRTTVDRDDFKDWAKEVDSNMTFMDWTYKLTGVDMTYVWDPELWVKFKEAVWHDHPQLFWNELMDRIEYSEFGACSMGAWACNIGWLQQWVRHCGDGAGPWRSCVSMQRNIHAF